MVKPTKTVHVSPKPVIHRMVCAFSDRMNGICLSGKFHFVFGLLKWGSSPCKTIQSPFFSISNGIIPSKLMCSSSRICISVPPPSFLRESCRLVWCPPGFAHKHPLFTVVSSTRTKTDTGIRFSKEMCCPWWTSTTPPIFICLKIIILCMITYSSISRSDAILSFEVNAKRIECKDPNRATYDLSYSMNETCRRLIFHFVKTFSKKWNFISWTEKIVIRWGRLIACLKNGRMILDIVVANKFFSPVHKIVTGFSTIEFFQIKYPSFWNCVRRDVLIEIIFLGGVVYKIAHNGFIEEKGCHSFIVSEIAGILHQAHCPHFHPCGCSELRSKLCFQFTLVIILQPFDVTFEVLLRQCVNTRTVFNFFSQKIRQRYSSFRDLPLFFLTDLYVQ